MAAPVGARHTAPTLLVRSHFVYLGIPAAIIASISFRRDLTLTAFVNGLIINFEVLTLEKPDGASRFDEPPRWARVSTEVAQDAPEDERAEATRQALEIGQKVKGWEYRLEDLDGLRTTKLLEDMLAPPKS